MTTLTFYFDKKTNILNRIEDNSTEQITVDTDLINSALDTIVRYNPDKTLYYRNHNPT